MNKRSKIRLNHRTTAKFCLKKEKPSNAESIFTVGCEENYRTLLATLSTRTAIPVIKFRVESILKEKPNACKVKDRALVLLLPKPTKNKKPSDSQVLTPS